MAKDVMKVFSNKLEDAIHSNNTEIVSERIQVALKTDPALVDIAGVSVMTILDDITSKKITEFDLQRLGLITDLKQWTEQTNQIFDKVKQSPRLQTQLKRLTRGFDAMYQAWRSDKLQNDGLKATLNEKADAQLLNLWQDNKENNEFFAHVTKMYAEQLGLLKDNWFTGKIEDEKLKATLDSHVANALVAEWNDDELITDTIKAAVMQRGQENLFQQLESNNLSDEFHKPAIDELGMHLYRLIEQRKLDKFSNLGLAIESKKQNLWDLNPRAAYIESIKAVLKDWFTKGLEDGAYEELKNIIVAHLPALIAELNNHELTTLRKIAFESLFDSMREGTLNGTIIDSFKNFGQDIIENELRLIRQEGNSFSKPDSAKLREDIAKSVIGSIRQEWQTSKLSAIEASFIDDHVLVEAKTLNRLIETTVYSTAMATEMAAKDRRISDLERQVAKLFSALSARGLNLDDAPKADASPSHSFFKTPGQS